ncbi:MAG: hypothetical protein HUJ98_01485 [Bacteroidaceae bacterium]|nr:hypothetical protein [Bacteroidaceae bacterium]
MKIITKNLLHACVALVAGLGGRCNFSIFVEAPGMTSQAADHPTDTGGWTMRWGFSANASIVVIINSVLTLSDLRLRPPPRLGRHQPSMYK